MDASLQDLVYYLTVPAGAMSLDESTLRLIEVEDDDLFERVWTGTEVKEQIYIASDARSSTPAVYLLNENVARVVFIDNSNNLQFYKFDTEKRRWVKVECLGSCPVHPNTQLSGCLDSNDRSIIFFQNVSGQLQGVSISPQGDVYLVPSPPACVAVIPSPAIHAAVTSDDKVPHLLFVAQGEVYNLAFNTATKEWQVVGRLALSGCDIKRFLVKEAGDATSLAVVALCANGALLVISGAARPVEFGRIVDGRYVAGTSRECAAEIAILVIKLIKKPSGGKKKQSK